MSGCPTHGPLVGGYALGALEPEEMEEMRRHVAVCPHCGPEAGRLAALPGLLDRIVPADVPPPTLSPQVEEAVLDRFARERREEAAGQAPERRAGRSTRRPALLGGSPGVLGRRLLAVGVASLVALVVALALLLPGDGDEGGTAYASVSLDAKAGGSGSATAWLGEVPAGTRIRLETRGLPAGSQYEVWCIRTDGRWVSGGTFWADRDGRTEAELTAAVRPGDYHRMVVTRRPEGAGEDARGPTVLRGPLRY
ncbi:MAG TPA: anti-sigma factor [Thermoleophilaceae bacterium]|nr:anti-sigma factor [Thermoleophilaceae bacterium]